jgi:hypothetical protein
MAGMARLVMRPDLDSFIARTVGTRVVDRLKRDIVDGAQRRAPDGKVWVTMLDERVRPSHADAHDQLIPANLRYQLTRMAYARKGRGKAAAPIGGWTRSAGHDLAREPRDPNLPAEQRVACRCRSIPVPEAIARTIHADVTVFQGTRVSAQVSTPFPRAAESEFGTGGDQPARFMAGAANAAAAKLRGGSARRGV